MLNNYNSNDAGKIFNFILTQLHEELIFNQDKYNKVVENPYDHFDENLSFKQYQKRFLQTSSQISDSCFLTIEIRKRCINCGVAAYFFEASPVINIYLKGENDNGAYNKISLEEHLKTLLITEEEENITENCLICSSEQKKL
jgi:hypothetical protein